MQPGYNYFYSVDKLKLSTVSYRIGVEDAGFEAYMSTSL